MPHHVPLIGLSCVVVGIACGADAWRCDAHAFGTGFGVGPRLVVVVHDVHIHAFTAVYAIVYPVVYHVVAHVHPLVGLCAGTRA